MRILHTSDWHLGLSLNNTSLLEEQRHFIGRLLEIVDEEKIDVVIVAGDVFDNAVSNADAIALYNEAMTQLCIEKKVPVLVCAGNHDGAARLASCGALLEKAGLYIAGSIRDGLKTVLIKDTAFHLLPFFSIEEVRFLYPDEEIKSYDAAMRVLMENEKKEKGKNVLVAHCFVTGAQVSDSDHSAMVGGANMVGWDAFQGFDYVALGHLHRAQDVAKGVRYSGAPVKYSFGEANAQKSVTVIDTEDFSYREVPLEMCHDVRVIKGAYEEILDFAQNDPCREDYVKIELTDEYAHMEIINTFRNFYRNLLSFAGKQLSDGNDETTLTVDETVSLHPEEIMKMFYSEFTGGEEPSENQLSWFRKALFAKKGGDAQ